MSYTISLNALKYKKSFYAESKENHQKLVLLDQKRTMSDRTWNLRGFRKVVAHELAYFVQYEEDFGKLNTMT